MFNNELFLLRFGKYIKQLLSIKEKALKIVKSVRGSTAAGINNSLLPRDCSCGEFACSAVWGRGFFSLHLLDFRWCCLGKRPFSWHLWGICRWCRVGKRSLFPDICDIRHLWHLAHSVPDRASWGTEYARGAQNRLLWYATHFQRHSVLKIGFYGTEGIFGTGNPLLWYRRRF